MSCRKIDSATAIRYIANPSVINSMFESTPSCQPQPEPASRHTRRKEARPGELLDAALDLFVEKGYAATKAEEVARHAGVSKGTLFLYFSSKEELFKAVVRKNIAGRFVEWNAEFDTFEGNTPDLLRYAMTQWWLRLGSTKASGITKLMLSEAHNFPELAAFYQHEVIQPAHVLIRRILQRGVDRGEFASIDMKYGVYTVLAPMLFLQLMMHSKNACIEPSDASAVDPQKYIAAQLQTILAGLCVRPAPTSFSEKLPNA
jgi:TetR/AcrR family transcriptional regulator